MTGPTTIQQVSASTAITEKPSQLVAVVLTADAATSTVEVRDGGSTGTVVLTLSVVANETVTFTPASTAALSKGIYLTLSGTGAVASVMYV